MLWAATIATSLAVFHISRGPLAPLIARVLPTDLSGPDGWFFDTENGTGIFDRRR